MEPQVDIQRAFEVLSTRKAALAKQRFEDVGVYVCGKCYKLVTPSTQDEHKRTCNSGNFLNTA